MTCTPGRGMRTPFRCAARDARGAAHPGPAATRRYPRSERPSTVPGTRRISHKSGGGGKSDHVVHGGRQGLDFTVSLHDLPRA